VAYPPRISSRISPSPVQGWSMPSFSDGTLIEFLYRQFPESRISGIQRTPAAGETRQGHRHSGGGEADKDSPGYAAGVRAWYRMGRLCQRPSASTFARSIRVSKRGSPQSELPRILEIPVHRVLPSGRREPAPARRKNVANMFGSRSYSARTTAYHRLASPPESSRVPWSGPQSGRHFGDGLRQEGAADHGRDPSSRSHR
jgi:hypothetical protein